MNTRSAWTVCMALVAATVLSGTAAAGDGQVDAPVVVRGAEQSAPVIPYAFDGDLRDLVPVRAWQPGDPIREIPRRYHGDGGTSSSYVLSPFSDPLAGQQRTAKRADDASFVTPQASFAGLGYTGVAPPDTVGDVGPAYYIQAINHGQGTVVQVFNKDGTAAAASFILDSLWTGGGNCASGYGDPIVLYDRLAGRWLLAEFTSSGDDLCVYLSKTGDPLGGGWWLYNFVAPNFPDYPKYAVWHDAYYVTSNEYDSGADVLEPSVYALERDKMLAGQAATSQRFAAPSIGGFTFEALLPADHDGGDPPPSATPGLFVRQRDDELHDGASTPATDVLELFEAAIDWDTPANSTFSGPTQIQVADFDSTLCGVEFVGCVPQPGTAQKLDPVREVLMWRLQYMASGSTESLLGNFVVDVGTDNHAIRWFELRRTAPAAWSLHDEGTFAPDSDHRWMGSVARDQVGNIALGYSVSSSSTFPSMAYTGRLVGDAAGTMTQTETVLAAGTASQTGFAGIRWGDYSAMSLDPEDDCTFWFTQEYTPSSSWSTWIGAFKFSTCKAILVFEDGFESGDRTEWSRTVH